MNLKKILALLLALAMMMTLAACGEEAKDGNDTKNDPDASNVDPLEFGLFINGEKVDTDGLVMMTIDGLEVPFDEYRYMYNYLDSYYFSGGDSTFWASNADALPVLFGYTEDYILENYWGNLLADKYGVEFTDEDLEEIETYVQEQRDYFETEEDYQNALAESGITEDLLRRLISQQIMGNRTYEELYSKEGAPLAPSDEEIKAALDENYVRVYHVLVAFDSFDGEEDEVKALALEVAQDMLQRLQDGEDIYEMAQNEGDDPGMYDNVDGYFFTYNEMVEPFETASFALEVGELSDIVETSYGYHIILRLEQDEYISEHWDELRADYINTVFNNDVNEMLANAKVEYCEYYDQLTADSIR